MNEISKYRAEVIERAINIEWIINAIISQHYFKYVNINFLFEVLYDQNITFALKRNILDKILQSRNHQNEQKMHELNRLNSIRNYFAHCNQEIYTIKSKEGFIPDPKKPENPIDFNKLYEEFITIAKQVESWLFEEYKGMGGIFSQTKPGL
jgi:hypothetical protein